MFDAFLHLAESIRQYLGNIYTYMCIHVTEIEVYIKVYQIHLCRNKYIIIIIIIILFRII